MDPNNPPRGLSAAEKVAWNANKLVDSTNCVNSTPDSFGAGGNGYASGPDTDSGHIASLPPATQEATAALSATPKPRPIMRKLESCSHRNTQREPAPATLPLPAVTRLQVPGTPPTTAWRARNAEMKNAFGDEEEELGSALKLEKIPETPPRPSAKQFAVETTPTRTAEQPTRGDMRSQIEEINRARGAAGSSSTRVDGNFGKNFHFAEKACPLLPANTTMGLSKQTPVAAPVARTGSSLPGARLEVPSNSFEFPASKPISTQSSEPAFASNFDSFSFADTVNSKPRDIFTSSPKAHDASLAAASPFYTPHIRPSQTASPLFPAVIPNWMTDIQIAGAVTPAFGPSTSITTDPSLTTYKPPAAQFDTSASALKVSSNEITMHDAEDGVSNGAEEVSQISAASPVIREDEDEDIMDASVGDDETLEQTLARTRREQLLDKNADMTGPSVEADGASYVSPPFSPINNIEAEFSMYHTNNVDDFNRDLESRSMEYSSNSNAGKVDLVQLEHAAACQVLSPPLPMNDGGDDDEMADVVNDQEQAWGMNLRAELEELNAATHADPARTYSDEQTSPISPLVCDAGSNEDVDVEVQDVPMTSRADYSSLQNSSTFDPSSHLNTTFQDDSPRFDAEMQDGGCVLATTEDPKIVTGATSTVVQDAAPNLMQTDSASASHIDVETIVEAAPAAEIAAMCPVTDKTPHGSDSRLPASTASKALKNSNKKVFPSKIPRPKLPKSRSLITESEDACGPDKFCEHERYIDVLRARMVEANKIARLRLLEVPEDYIEGSAKDIGARSARGVEERRDHNVEIASRDIHDVQLESEIKCFQKERDHLQRSLKACEFRTMLAENWNVTCMKQIHSLKLKLAEAGDMIEQHKDKLARKVSVLKERYEKDVQSAKDSIWKERQEWKKEGEGDLAEQAKSLKEVFGEEIKLLEKKLEKQLKKERKALDEEANEMSDNYNDDIEKLKVACFREKNHQWKEYNTILLQQKSSSKADLARRKQAEENLVRADKQAELAESMAGLIRVPKPDSGYDLVLIVQPQIIPKVAMEDKATITASLPAAEIVVEATLLEESKIAASISTGSRRGANHLRPDYSSILEAPGLTIDTDDPAAEAPPLQDFPSCNEVTDTALDVLDREVTACLFADEVSSTSSNAEEIPVGNLRTSPPACEDLIASETLQRAEAEVVPTGTSEGSKLPESQNSSETIIPSDTQSSDSNLPVKRSRVLPQWFKYCFCGLLFLACIYAARTSAFGPLSPNQNQMGGGQTQAINPPQASLVQTIPSWAPTLLGRSNICTQAQTPPRYLRRESDSSFEYHGRQPSWRDNWMNTLVWAVAGATAATSVGRSMRGQNGGL